MSTEGKIEVVKRAIREGEITLKTIMDLLELYSKAVPGLERGLESDKKRLEELGSDTNT